VDRVTFSPRIDIPHIKSRDPIVLIKTANPAMTPYIYLTAGNDEPLLDPDRRFAEALRESRFRYQFHTMSGGHDLE